MNWFADQTDTNNYINTNLYGGLSQSEGIDLRVEMHWLLYGKNSAPTTKPKGHWVIYRRFNRTQKSQFYSERTKEGVGGPAYVYTDELLRTRRVPTDKAGIPLDPVQLGSEITERYLYYFEYTIVPKVGDNIFEIEWSDHSLTPVLGNIVYKDKYSIKRVHDYRLENGNIQYFITSTQYDEVNY